MAESVLMVLRKFSCCGHNLIEIGESRKIIFFLANKDSFLTVDGWRVHSKSLSYVPRPMWQRCCTLVAWWEQFSYGRLTQWLWAQNNRLLGTLKSEMNSCHQWSLHPVICLLKYNVVLKMKRCNLTKSVVILKTRLSHWGMRVCVVGKEDCLADLYTQTSSAK